MPGSSPLARGLRSPLGLRDHSFGIIPARAGFTLHSRTTRPSIRDHPRSRGVYLKVSERAKSIRGSSPLARGLLEADARLLASRGIIPARAGFTRSGLRQSRLQWDHPRSRGVYTFAGDMTPADTGSSPLARGLPCGVCGGGAGHGIIPARAGFTLSRRQVRRIFEDHPRSRGVYILVDCGDSTEGGSSPLARGLPAEAMQASEAARIIPARAGFTEARPCS